MYMTDAYRQRGPIPIVPDMLIYHENSTFSIRGLLDRQLREIFSVSDQVERDGARPNPSALFRKVMQTALKRPGRQLRLVRRFGRSLGIRPWHAPLVWTMLSLHALLNIVASLAILVSPGLTRRWLHYQFGVAREDSGNALSAEAADRVDA
jgi:hypothetical protein